MYYQKIFFNINRSKVILFLFMLSLILTANKKAAARNVSSDRDVAALLNIVREQSSHIRVLENRIVNLEKHFSYSKKNKLNTHSSISARKSIFFGDGEVTQNTVVFSSPDDFINEKYGLGQYDVFPLKPSPPGSFGAISSMPSNSAPVSGVASEIPNRTTMIGGLVLKWGKGLPEITTPDGNYSFRIRGRILADYGAVFGSRYDALNVSRTMMRAARLGVEGRAQKLSWVFESDFSSNKITVMSAFATWTDKTLGHTSEYTLGNKFSERSFDGSTGSSETVFLDRDLVANTLTPVMGWYGLGASYKIYGKNWHFSAQIAGDQVNGSNIISNTRDDMTYLFRSHYIPYKSNVALIHVGVWGFYEDVKPSNNYTQNVSVLSRVDSAFNMQFGPTAPLSHSYAGGIELFGIWHSMWSLIEFGAREMYLRRTSGFPESNLLHSGQKGTEKAFSAQYGWFITGETPNYFAHSGVWAAPRVLYPVTRGGMGAWEAAVRWDWADSSKIISGSSAWTVSLGVNWYILNYARIMFNFTHAHVYNESGEYLGNYGGNTFGSRMSITF